MKRFQHHTKRSNVLDRLKHNLSVKKIVVGILLIALLVLLAERFITEGTLLGYQLRDIKKANTQQIAKDGKEQPSEACRRISAENVKSILGLEMVRVGGIFADRTEPTFISSCTYRSKQTPSRTVTVVIRDVKDEAAAKASLEATSKRTESISIAKLGDGANFSKPSQQLTIRKGKQISTVTVSKPRENSQISSQEAATKIAEIVIN